MKTLLIALIEDEENMRNELRENISRFFNENQINVEFDTFSSAELLINTFRSDYDIIFMDINLPGYNGLEASQKLREMNSKAMIIFVTSLAQYAVEGYKVDAFDYMVKPVSYSTLSLTLKRVMKKLNSLNETLIVVLNKQGMKKIEIDSIKYLEIVDHKLIFHCTTGDYETRGTLKEYVKVLEKYSFALCNQCFLVNLKYITEVTQSKVFIGKEGLPISRPKKKEFLSKLNIFLCQGG